MKLVCVHCDVYDARPLGQIPPGWVEITHMRAPEAGHDTLGHCPACQKRHRTAYTVPLDPERRQERTQF